MALPRWRTGPCAHTHSPQLTAQTNRSRTRAKPANSTLRPGRTNARLRPQPPRRYRHRNSRPLDPAGWVTGIVRSHRIPQSRRLSLRCAPLQHPGTLRAKAGIKWPVWPSRMGKPLRDTPVDFAAGMRPPCPKALETTPTECGGWGLNAQREHPWKHKRWCADWFLPKRYGNWPAHNHRGPAIGVGRVMRVGSYLYHDSYCNRFRVAARTSSSNCGFRTASSRNGSQENGPL